MKKIIFTLILASITTFTFAQSTFRLALSAYPNIGFLKVENGKSAGQSLGFTYGLNGDFEFAENYSFSTGVLVTSINGRGEVFNYPPYYVSTKPAALYNIKFKMQYFEIPLAIKLKTDEVNDLRWYGQFGFTTGFRVGAKQDVEENNTLLVEDAKATSLTNFFRAGILIGGGAEYKVFGNTALTGGITYNNGLTNISSKGSKVKNHYIAINFGILF